MTLFVISLIILVSILLVLVILAQNPKGGLSSQFGGSGTSNIIGVKKTTDLLENITWSLAIGLFVLALSINFMTESTTQGYTSPNIERAQEQLVLPSIDIDANEDAATSSEEPQGLDDLIEDQE
ncbi:MAG: preprotein translocase subunit SecG [Bacteroidetes bacterium]|nr:preprotein translocase subunit SecG [Bacteroidota bacterium]